MQSQQDWRVPQRKAWVDAGFLCVAYGLYYGLEEADSRMEEDDRGRPEAWDEAEAQNEARDEVDNRVDRGRMARDEVETQDEADMEEVDRDKADRGRPEARDEADSRMGDEADSRMEEEGDRGSMARDEVETQDEADMEAWEADRRPEARDEAGAQGAGSCQVLRRKQC